MALQARQQQAALRSGEQAEDQLASAAHLLAGALQGPYRCLISQPSSEWQTSPLPNGCAEGLEPARLQRLKVGDAEVIVRSWQPDGSGSGGTLWLQLKQQGAEHRYRLMLTPALGLQEVG